VSQVDARQQKRIFIVDDHPLIRRIFKQILDLDPDVVVIGEAVSGEDALRQLERAAPDLCLIDFSLPGIDGAELVRQLRKKRPGLRCMVVSSHHEPLYIEQALAAGACGFVTKGDPDVLLGAIARVLRGEVVVENGC
jgi:DNA-binding NarL/FixJ family response regulator